MKRVILLLATLGLFATGCCNDQCDCLGPGFYIAYESDSTASCDEDIFRQATKIYRFNATTDDLVFEGEAPLHTPCELWVSYEDNRYWVIESDSLGIADTLRVQSINLKDDEEDDDGGCCDCPPAIKSATVTINGQLYETHEAFYPQQIERSY